MAAGRKAEMLTPAERRNYSPATLLAACGVIVLVVAGVWALATLSEPGFQTVCANAERSVPAIFLCP